jgi:undecaprenyl-diphosphatase
VVRAGPGRGGWLALAAGLFTALAVLAAGINADWLAALDTSVADWFDAHRSRRRDQQAAGVFGYIGRPVHVLVAAMVCGTLLSIRARSAMPVIGVTGAVGLGVVVEQTFKAVIGRTASAGPLVDYPHSFPSGHVTGTAALLGTIAVFLGVGSSRTVRSALAVLVAAAVLAVAVLALYTGAHTFSDVIGGMLLGGAIVALCAAGVRPRA